MQSLNFQETCEKLNLAASTVQQLLNKGKFIGAEKVEGKWVVPESAVIAYQKQIIQEQTRTLTLADHIRPHLTRKKAIAVLVILLSAAMFGVNSYMQYNG